MIMIFGIPGPLLFGQLLLGLINGAFYAMLSLGLAVIWFAMPETRPERLTARAPPLA